MLSSSTPFFLHLHTLHLRFYPQQDHLFHFSFDSELILWDFETNPVDPLDFESKDGVLTLWFAIQSNLQYPQADIFLGKKPTNLLCFFPFTCIWQDFKSFLSLLKPLYILKLNESLTSFSLTFSGFPFTSCPHLCIPRRLLHFPLKLLLSQSPEVQRDREGFVCTTTTTTTVLSMLSSILILSGKVN